MNAEEAARLLVLVSEFCPQQVFTAADEDRGIPGSAAMWASVLDDVSYRDASAAVKRLVKKQRFIAVSEVRETVAAIRAERLDALPVNKRPVPNVDPADVHRYARAVRAIERAIADGDIRPDGHGGLVLPSAQWQHAIESGVTVGREVDYSQVFSEQRAALRAHRQAEGEAEQAARAAEAAERQRQLDALAHMIEGYETTRTGKLARKRKLSRRITKPLAVVADDGTTMEPRAERDAAAS